jgi:hypothetical protein
MKPSHRIEHRAAADRAKFASKGTMTAEMYKEVRHAVAALRRERQRIELEEQRRQRIYIGFCASQAMAKISALREEMNHHGK